MNTISLIAGKLGLYTHKPGLPVPAPNADAVVGNQVTRAQTQPNDSLREHGMHLEKTASEVTADIQKFIQANQRQFRVSKDEVSGYMVIQLIDPSTGQVIRTLPNDEVLRLARSFEMLGSTMVHQKA